VTGSPVTPAAALDVPHRGRAWKFGDSVDTNQLAGGGLVATPSDDVLRGGCLRSLRPDFADGVLPGDYLVAGRNFGCGSSRQTAVEALQLCGVSAVLAESVARIHRRNSIARALPTLIAPGITAAIDDGDELELDYPRRLVSDLTKGTAIAVEALSPSVEAIYRAGGLTAVITARLTAAGFPPDPS
jgi:3-isopropylmalate/(R)-2-methylmalate dehydratase small subunit